MFELASGLLPSGDSLAVTIAVRFSRSYVIVDALSRLALEYLLGRNATLTYKPLVLPVSCMSRDV